MILLLIIHVKQANKNIRVYELFLQYLCNNDDIQRVDKSIRAFFHLILNIEFSSHTWLSRYNLFIWSRHWLHSELRYRYLIVHPRVAIIVQIRHSKRSTKFRKFLNAFYAPYVTSRFQAEHIEGVLMSSLHHDMHYISY